GASVAARVVDAWHLDRAIRELLHDDLPPALERQAVASHGGGRALARLGVDRVPVEALDHARVVVADEVHHDLPVALERVDVVKAEQGIGLEVGYALAAVAVKDIDPRRAI